MLVITLIMSRIYRGEGPPYRNGAELPMTRLGNGNGKGVESYQPLTREFHDEESDIEFEQPVDKSQPTAS